MKRKLEISELIFRIISCTLLTIFAVACLYPFLYAVSASISGRHAVEYGEVILLPKEGLEDLGCRKVVWSDLDGNGHLYSSRYGDIIWDYLPADLQDLEVKEFYLNYSKEATLGQELRLVGISGEDGYRLEGFCPDGVCFTARIVC